MSILFIRIIVMYLLVFAVIRLSGKRQLSQLQPFDLVITLLIADLASMPMEDPSVPLSYGVVPILTLFLMQKLIAHLVLKSKRIRTLACGTPLLIINHGKVEENTMRQANYSMEDLTEHLRTMSIFDITDVDCAVLETNGSLSVLRKSECDSVTCRDLNVPRPPAQLSYSVIIDGDIIESALRQSGKNAAWLDKQLKCAEIGDKEQVFYAQICSDDTLVIQTKDKDGARVITTGGKKSDKQ